MKHRGDHPDGHSRMLMRILELPAMALFLALSVLSTHAEEGAGSERPNILIAITDDHSWLHTSVQGSPFLETPAMDSIAEAGFRFTNAYAGSPGCSPSRAALLTGRHHWMIGPAGTHGSSFPVHYETFVDVLERAGYKVGYTGKGWGPGDWLVSGRQKNPAGIEYNEAKLTPPRTGISSTDYAGNFERFMAEREAGQPFYFWAGGHEPHLKYAEIEHPEADLAKVEVPGFLPNTKTSRSMLLDYAYEIEHFDAHLGRILATIEAAGELDNTLVIFTADNGMPMPRAKANGYDYGIHVPLHIRWDRGKQSGRVVETPVGFVDLSATVLETAGLETPEQFQGQSLLGLLNGDLESLNHDRVVFSGRERHSSSRYRNLTYPQRMMRRGNYLVIWNAAPERHPAGAPRNIVDGEPGPPHGAYFDID
ncbi:MAG: sulfatase-like hydrolase/transferase, partial [Xanthomonadales bacterium]|nr:sulfatase [Xanthomonadales bacterium]NIX13803.1 sulfatase-like hydrolase/transferase [Xanthomonadales bacterium]